MNTQQDKQDPDYDEGLTDKWTTEDYGQNDDGTLKQLYDWKPPKTLIYPCGDTEKAILHALKDAFAPLPPYKQMEAEAEADNTLVTVDIQGPSGFYAFLENTAEHCTSPQTKHSREGMQSARHWLQRLDTAWGIFQRLTDGYGISLMFGERFHQFIRNSNNWRGASGVQLDIDAFKESPDTIREKASKQCVSQETLLQRLADNESRPDPVFSMSELLERYPILEQICSYILPSASSLYQGRPFKARGLVFFPYPITDMRVYRAVGDALCNQIDCIPKNVTKNPVAVGFGNTHNADKMWCSDTPDIDQIAAHIKQSKEFVLQKTKSERIQQKQRAERRERYEIQSANGNRTRGKENISDFMDRCNPVSEMIKQGLLTETGNNQYKWHESENDRSCDIVDTVIWIFSASMAAASPTNDAIPVNAHRFYLYQSTGLDVTRDADKDAIRTYLFSLGYGDDPEQYKQQCERKQHAKLQVMTDEQVETHTVDHSRQAVHSAADAFIRDATEQNVLDVFLVQESTGSGKTTTLIGKAQALEQRTIMQTPHNDLAEEAVRIAMRLGIHNPQHIKGRSFGWNDSIANIPKQDRDETLFEKALCIMYDDVQRYEKANLPPRLYCELKCEHKRSCAYLAQYKAAADSNFIVTSTPALYFDLSYRGYLNYLTSLKDTPTDEMLALDAMLDLETETTEPFTFAILDDYTVARLYSDISLKKSHFKRLVDAWKGTPTADFAEQLIKAFDNDTHETILTALRTAYQSTAENHEQINNGLRTHARHGVIDFAPSEKWSKETDTLLADKQVVYKDGAPQYIPVSDAAYKELKSKGIPVVNPKHVSTADVGDKVIIPHTPALALMVGIEPEKITPTWGKGTTPIDTIRLLLENVSTDSNAPITRQFLPSGDCVIIFTIPPQAPVGTISKLAMLSATTDTQQVKSAFDGQAVRFSEHTGGALRWAEGVFVGQFTGGRVTTASVFAYEIQDDGTRKAVALKGTAKERLAKLNAWAAQEKGLTAFISFKEFTDSFKENVSNFDIITHFDKVAGMNFDGLKFLVVFGYPKVKHEVVIEQARRQFASSTDTIPTGDYEELTEERTITEAGIKSTERRYRDHRLERIRQQLSTDKLKQAIRTRLAVWKHTTTLIFTSAPLGSITERATLFSAAAFRLAETPKHLSDAMKSIAEAEKSGNVKAIAETQGLSERQAYRKSEDTRKQNKVERDTEICTRFANGESKAAIARAMKISRPTVDRVLAKQVF